MSVQEYSGNAHFAFDIDLSAPRDRVWQAFATHNQFGTWFNHDPDWYLHVPLFDFRVDGGTRVEFGPDRHVYTEVLIYEEIEDTRRIVMTSEMTEGTGYLKTLVALTFADNGTGTRLTVREDGIPADTVEDRRIGWGKTIHNLKRFQTA
ncbi:MAG: SRPBCC domain-containing protein [Alphaproteobacteria bacterium]